MRLTLMCAALLALVAAPAPTAAEAPMQEPRIDALTPFEHGALAAAIGDLIAEDQLAVLCTVYRATQTVQASRAVKLTWAVHVSNVRVLLGQLRERDRYALGGRDLDAEYLGAVLPATDVLRGDRIKVDAGAAHHAGETYLVLADPVPEALYRLLLLSRLERGDPTS